jgi:hypothetical protein
MRNDAVTQFIVTPHNICYDADIQWALTAYDEYHNRITIPMNNVIKWQPYVSTIGSHIQNASLNNILQHNNEVI